MVLNAGTREHKFHFFCSKGDAPKRSHYHIMNFINNQTSHRRSFWKGLKGRTRNEAQRKWVNKKSFRSSHFFFFLFVLSFNANEIGLSSYIINTHLKHLILGRMLISIRLIYKYFIYLFASISHVQFGRKGDKQYSEPV